MAGEYQAKPRTIQITVASDRTEDIIQRVRQVDGVIGAGLQRGVSLDPPGDVLTVHATNEGTRAVLDVLDDLKVVDGGAIATSEPRLLVSQSHQEAINRESNETVWDEMAFLLRRDTNLSNNYLAAMALAGGIAAVGLGTNTLHIVIGAMLVAPGFEPLVRIPFGLIAGPRTMTSRGVVSLLAGYLLLALGAATTYWLMRGLGLPVPPDLSAQSLVGYWSKFSPTGVVVAILAGAAGAVVVNSQRSVLSTGVMLALALIPSAAIVGMALADGQLGLAGGAALRWLEDTGCVLASSFAVLGVKRLTLHKHRAAG